MGFGEGDDEETLIKYLRTIVPRGSSRVTVHNAGGGSPEKIITKAIRFGAIGYNRAFIVMDSDVVLPKSYEKKARAAGFKIIKSVPCLEGMLLSVIESKTNWARKTSKECVKYFEKKYNEINTRSLAKLFPPKILKKIKNKKHTLRQILLILTK